MSPPVAIGSEDIIIRNVGVNTFLLHYQECRSKYGIAYHLGCGKITKTNMYSYIP